MVEKLRFYTRHSLNDLWVNKQRTLFALLCIAAGVAAIVSLQTLGVMIEDSLTGSVQEANRGDIRISMLEELEGEEDQSEKDAAIEQATEDGLLAEDDLYDQRYISPAGIELIQNWVDEHAPGSQVTYRQVTVGAVAGMIVSNPDNEAEQPFVSPYIIDARQYPLYGTRATEAGEPLSAVLQAPTDMVLSRNLADSLGAEVGDTLKVSGATQNFTVRGIVPTKDEGGFENIIGNIIGYYYLDLSALGLFEDSLPPGASEMYIRLADPAQVDTVN